MIIRQPHLLERLGADHISWCVRESEEELQARIELAREDDDEELARCYEEVQQLKAQYRNLSHAS